MGLPNYFTTLLIMGIGERQRQVFYGALALALFITALAYRPGLNGPFVFDDLTNLIDNPALQQAEFSFDALKQAALSRDSGTLHRPVAMLSFALNAAFAKFDVFYYKLTNLIIHLLNGLGIYWLSLRLLRRYQAQQPDLSSMPIAAHWLSFAICVVWLLHPLNLTSVLYVVQRMNSLATLFTLFGLIGYTLGREQIIQGMRRGFTTIVLSLLLCGGLAVFSKESGVLLILYIIAIEAIFFRLAASPRLQQSFRWFFYVLFVTPLIIGLIVILFNAEDVLGLKQYQYYPFTLTERLLTEARALWFYLQLIVLPDITQMGLYHDDFPISRGLWDPPSTLFACIGIIALLAVAIAYFRKAPILSFGILWFFVGHSLESSIIPLEPLHEHRNYLAQFGILFVLIFYYAHFAFRYISFNRAALRFVPLFLYIMLLAHGTYARAGQWANEFTLYAKDVRNHPDSARANTTLAILLHDNKQYDTAATYFSIAATSDSVSPKPIIRLIQNQYIAGNTIPGEWLTELDRRLQSSPFHVTTISTYVPLLNATRNQSTLNLQLAVLFSNYIDNKAVIHNGGWAHYGYLQLAKNYRATNNPSKALLYLSKAVALRPTRVYYLARAELYFELKQNNKARDMLDKLAAQDKNLEPKKLQRLERLREKLKASSGN